MDGWILAKGGNKKRGCFFKKDEGNTKVPQSALRHRITDCKKDPQRVAAAIFHSEHRTEQMHYPSP